MGTPGIILLGGRIGVGTPGIILLGGRIGVGTPGIICLGGQITGGVGTPGIICLLVGVKATKSIMIRKTKKKIIALSMMSSFYSIFL